MAEYTRHPIAAPPQAPARESSRRLLLRAHAIILTFAFFCAPALDHALTTAGAAVVFILLTLGTLGWWIPRIVRHRLDDPFPWRRLPWAAIGYVLLAGLSLLWTAWPALTLLTWTGLVVTTVNGLFLASMLSWRELVKTIASALKWALGLSLLFELFVSVVIRTPILPPFVTAPSGKIDPQLYWSRDNLLSDGRIQGIVGNANLLAMICVIAVLVFAVRLAGKTKRRGWLVAWIVLALFLLWRSGSATALLSLAAAVVVLLTILIMRATRRPGQRTLAYSCFTLVGVVAALIAVVFRDAIFGALGRSDSLTGRGPIWEQVLAHAWQRPVLGWGFASPWVPTMPGFEPRITDHDELVMQAHDMWVDVFFQLGFVGIVVIAVVFLALLWRAWFFAVDRPRWDADAHRPYARLSVLPTLLLTVLLVQGITESNPVMVWGWLLVVTLSFKIKLAPIIGVGADEQTIERGLAPRPPR
ncbi:O-antigen ligase family protein [Microbacterium gorillae]|uniref:O-antigen ligase family protein n=1 Tax=Microbacterium gorillae TaxID=1231063 RepID=UPI000590BEB3|nr:O-antigen ligase family protein [Microbacterium gorillae]